MFKKTKIDLTLKALRQQVTQAGSDPNQPTLEEISQIVNEVRQELWTKRSHLSRQAYQ